MFCKNCGKELTEDIKFCPNCGTPQVEQIQENTKPENKNVSIRSRSIAALLAFFLGALGIHRFYVGKNGTAILQIILTFCYGIGAIWALIDLVMILCGSFKDKDDLLVLDWDIK